MNKTDAFLQHYVEQPYDPIKAHEYYMKNRQLKGRSTSGMSQEQKEAWLYSKDRITTDKNKQLETAKALNDKKIEDFRTSAEATRSRISAKLKLLGEKLTKDAEREREKITDRVNSAIAKLPPIPDGITGEQRAVLVEKRNKEMEKIRNTANLDRADLTENTTLSRTIGMDDVFQERAKIESDLKAIIDTTRESYTKAKAKIVAEYETIYQKEYAKVLSTIKGKPKAKKKGKGKKAPKEKKSGIIYYNGVGPTR